MKRCVFTWQNGTNVVADTLLTLSKNLNGTITTGTTFGPSAGKRLRITGIAFSLKAGAAAAAFATMNLRSLAGPVLIGSPSILRLDVGNTAAAIGAAVFNQVTPLDMFEFYGLDQIGVSLACQAITNIVSISLIGYEYTP